MNWNKKEVSPLTVKELSARYGLDLLTASILARRGITDPAELLYYPRGRSPLSPRPLPLLADGGRGGPHTPRRGRGREGPRLRRSRYRRSHEHRGDGRGAARSRDRGGMARSLSREAYGLSIAAVEEFAASGGTLIVTVDCGISNHAEIERASELGIDVIVTDHHRLQAGDPPPALAVIDPKLPDSGYPFRDLAGCGVVYKLASALKLARTGIYKQQVALLNVRPVNDAYAVEAVRLSNLVETGRVSETIVPGMVDLGRTRLVPFLQDRQIFVWDGALQRRLLEKALGKGAEVLFYDLAPDAGEYIPQTKGQSLLRLKELSKIGRYSSGDASRRSTSSKTSSCPSRSRRPTGSARTISSASSSSPWAP